MSPTSRHRHQDGKRDADGESSRVTLEEDNAMLTNKRNENKAWPLNAGVSRDPRGLFGVYLRLPRAARIQTDYYFMPDFCRNDKTKGGDDPSVRAHDFPYMLTEQFGAWAGWLATYVLPFAVMELVLSAVGFLLWDTWLFRDCHHVFIDMLVLREKYPAVFAMLADKEKQQHFYKTRYLSGDETAGGVGSGACPLSSTRVRFPHRYRIADRPLQSETELMTKQSEDEVEATASCLVFVKPKTGAYGEDTQICDLAVIHDMYKTRKADWNQARVDFLLFEELLVTSRDFQQDLLRHGLVKSMFHPLVTIRIWTKRLGAGRDRDFVAALLIPDEHEIISNGKRNNSLLVEELPEEVEFLTKEKENDKSHNTNTRYGVRTNSNASGGYGGYMEIPFFATMLEFAQWAHNQTDFMPMLGHDFAVCNGGAYFIETNPMCSYTRYAHLFAARCKKQNGSKHFYTLEEMESYVRSHAIAWGLDS
ncbi:unnamed protein product [Amoebophrya sp. A25]|nr:unnamed protein product [Amoebophrya sp. A25]|eukprot:GSA25T00023540001.1